MSAFSRRVKSSRRFMPFSVLTIFGIIYVFQLSSDIFRRRSSDLYKVACEKRLNDSVWRQPTLLNLTFKWIQNNESICGGGGGNDNRILPVLVHSARSHFEERLVIRRSWGLVTNYRGWTLRLIFLLGEGRGAINGDSLENTKISEENAKFGDVIVGSFLDTYHNLTYKHLMGYKWILNFCPNAEVILKVDDDVFIDIFQWLDWLSSEDSPDIYCKVWLRPQPFRRNTSKWYMSREDWPEKYYPSFCSGWAYTIRRNLMEKVYALASSIKFNWIDDLFVTGQLVKLVKDKCGDDTIKVKDLTEDYAMTGTCEENVKVIRKVERGRDFEKDMMCMWNLARRRMNINVSQPYR